MDMWYKFVACFAIWLAAAQIRASSMQTELTKMIWNINVMLLRLAILNVLRILLGGGGGGGGGVTNRGVRQLCFQHVLTVECWQLACVILHDVSLLCRFQYGGTQPSLKKTFSCSKYFGSMRTKLILPVWSLFSQHKHYLFCSKSWCVVKHVCVIKHMLVHFCAQCCIWHHILTLLFVECTHLFFWRNSHIKVLSLPPTISLFEASCLQEALGGGRDLFMFF